MNSEKEKNLSVLKVGVFPWSFLLLLGITVPYFQSKGFSLEEIFFCQSVFSISLSLFELPSGYFSDKVSRKLTLLIGGLTKGIGGLLVIYADSFPLLILTFFFLGIANSFFSGTDIAILHDLYQDDGKTIVREMANLHTISNISSTVGIMAGGLVANYSIDLAVIINGIVACLPFFVFLFLVEPVKVTSTVKVKFTDILLQMKNDFINCVKIIFNKGVYVIFIVILIVFLRVPTVISLLTFQKTFMILGISNFYITVIIATSSLFSAFLSKKLPNLSVGLSRNTIVLVCLLIASLSYFFNSTQILALSILGFFMLDILKLLIAVYLINEFNSLFDATLRSTLNSFLSLISRLVLAIIAPAWGYLITTYGMNKSSLLMGSIFLAICLTTFLIIRKFDRVKL